MIASPDTSKRVIYKFRYGDNMGGVRIPGITVSNQDTHSANQQYALIQRYAIIQRYGLI